MTLLLPLLACATSDDATTATSAQSLTWFEHAAPIVKNNCAHCHAGENIGPSWVTDGAAVAATLGVFTSYLEAGIMPPPAADPTCRPYVGDEHLFLTPEDRQTLLDWAEQGAALGSDSGFVMESTVGSLEAPDAVAMAVDEFLVATDGDSNKYTCFVLDFEPTEDTWLTALDVVADPRVAHHAVLYLDTTGDPGAHFGSPGANSFDCRDDLDGDGWTFLHGWAPGMVPTVMPDGMGLKVKPGQRLVMQMHYYDDASQGIVDRPGYTLHTAGRDAISKDIYVVPAGSYSFTIPAGEVHTADESLTNEWLDITVYGTFPHMHRLGSAYEMRIDHEDGTSTCVARADAWEFNNQQTYMFEEPLVWSPGDAATTSCTWDNTAGDEAVRFGESTDQEMCFFFTYVSY